VLEPGAVVVVNDSLFTDPIAGDRWRVHGLPATRMATECGSALAGALVLVGAYAAVTGIVALDALVSGLEASLPERRRQHRELNERALRAGFAAVPANAAPAWPREAQGGRRSRPTRSEPQASEGGPLHGGAA
jgi:Pyruvate/2-oxoacid:ferredoxin oxidoreductase gamma subunit